MAAFHTFVTAVHLATSVSFNGYTEPTYTDGNVEPLVLSVGPTAVSTRLPTPSRRRDFGDVLPVPKHRRPLAPWGLFSMYGTLKRGLRTPLELRAAPFPIAHRCPAPTEHRASLCPARRARETQGPSWRRARTSRASFDA